MRDLDFYVKPFLIFLSFWFLFPYILLTPDIPYILFLALYLYLYFYHAPYLYFALYLLDLPC